MLNLIRHSRESGNPGPTHVASPGSPLSRGRRQGRGRMFTKILTLSVASGLLASAAFAADAPGVTATDIKIGQTMAYSGPVSPYSVIGKVEAAYFTMINDQGGVNGRKIVFDSVDDGYNPAKTVE